MPLLRQSHRGPATMETMCDSRFPTHTNLNTSHAGVTALNKNSKSSNTKLREGLASKHCPHARIFLLSRLPLCRRVSLSTNISATACPHTHRHPLLRHHFQIANKQHINKHRHSRAHCHNTLFEQIALRCQFDLRLRYNRSQSTEVRQCLQLSNEVHPRRPRRLVLRRSLHRRYVKYQYFSSCLCMTTVCIMFSLVNIRGALLPNPSGVDPPADFGAAEANRPKSDYACSRRTKCVPAAQEGSLFEEAYAAGKSNTSIFIMSLYDYVLCFFVFLFWWK